jgi:hypothetical protein
MNRDEATKKIATLSSQLRNAQMGQNMQKIEELSEILRVAFANNLQLLLEDILNSVEAVTDVINRFSQLEDLPEGSGEASNRYFERIGNWCGNFANEIALKYGLLEAGISVLVRLWNEFSLLQLTSCQSTNTFQYIYKAGVAMHIGRIYWHHQDLGGAIWWFLHGRADDLLNGTNRGANYQMLRLGFNVSDEILTFMEQKVQESLQNQAVFGWFAEHIVVQLSHKPEYSRLFAYPTAIIEFPVGKAYARALLELVLSTSEGKPMERLARYLLLLLSGWVTTENKFYYRTRMDSDLIARYIRETESISSANGKIILAECKNVNGPVELQDVGFFLYRMHLTGVDVGILFTKKNVSGHGRTTLANSEYLLYQAYHKDGIIGIVLDQADLDQLVNGTRTMWTILESNITIRRFGKESNS